MYDFDTRIDRRNTNSLKWGGVENKLPIWVADMDFQTAPEIRAAIEARAAHGVFGYLLWLDCTEMMGFAWEAAYLNRERTGLYLSAGKPFGGSGESFLRMNVACPRAALQDGVERLKTGVAAYEAFALNCC